MHPLIRKLVTIAELPEQDVALLDRVTEDVRDFAARRDIVREGQEPDAIHLMVEGWSCRYQILRNGSRQITALLLPGDWGDAHATIFDRMDHSIATLTPAKVAFVSRALMTELTERPAIARALWQASLVDEAVLRAWIVNLGRRDAYDRIAHLICETHARLRNVGLVEDGRFDMPLTQEELGDALGLTAVHVNRSLKRLSEDGIATFKRGRIVIEDLDRLSKAGGFDAGYLHLARSQQPAAATAG